MTLSLLHFPQNSLLTLNQNSHFLFHWGSRNSQKTFTKFCSQLSDLLSSVPTYFNFTSRTLLEVTSYPLLLHLISSPLSFLKTVSLEILYSLFLMHHFFSFYGCPLDTCYNIFHFTKPFYLACPPHCCPTSLLYFVAKSTRSIHASVLYLSFLSSRSYLNWLSWGFCFWYAATSLLTGLPRISMMTNPMDEFSVLNLFPFSILPWKTFIWLWGFLSFLVLFLPK